MRNVVKLRKTAQSDRRDLYGLGRSDPHIRWVEDEDFVFGSKSNDSPPRTAKHLRKTLCVREPEQATVLCFEDAEDDEGNTFEPPPLENVPRRSLTIFKVGHVNMYRVWTVSKTLGVDITKPYVPDKDATESSADKVQFYCDMATFLWYVGRSVNNPNTTPPPQETAAEIKLRKTKLKDLRQRRAEALPVTKKRKRNTDQSSDDEDEVDGLWLPEDKAFIAPDDGDEPRHDKYAEEHARVQQRRDLLAVLRIKRALSRATCGV